MIADFWMFVTSSAFQKEVLYRTLDFQELEESSALRACCVFMHYELVDIPAKCKMCKADLAPEQGRSSNELFWLCSENRTSSTSSNTCLFHACQKYAPTTFWGFQFLHSVVFMLCNEKISRIVEELESAHGTTRSTFFCWEKIYHEALSNYVKKRGLNKVGGKNERCPVDETAVGKVGRMVGKPASKKGSFVRAADRIRARRPCKTIWKPKAKAFPKAKPGSLPRTSAATSLLNGCGWLCKLERMVNSHAHTKMATKRWQWMFYLMLRKHPRGNPEVRNT